MIETPRAALRAGEIAEEADFFSFGTNDLTQMTFGFSRDDVEGRMMSAYLEQGLLKRNPFEVVDPDGVGELVRLGVERGRATRPIAQDRRVRRARGRPRVDRHLRQGRSGLRELLAVPGARSPGWPRPRPCWPATPQARTPSGQGRLEAKATAEPPSRGLATPAAGRTVRRTEPAGDAVPSSPMGIPDEDVARVRAATDIVALIGEHAALKRQGRRWVGLCPFHGEKTPSFSVNAEEGFYYCFGCQAKGDAITFVRAIEHLDFVDAVRRLADKAGITIHEDADRGRDSQRRKVFLDAMEQATEWYHQRLLAGADAGQARDYLRSRGYDGEVVRRFRLGWAPDDWDELCTRPRPEPRSWPSAAGLGFVNRRGRLQDAFRARILFPICDPSGHPVALGGRVLPGSSDPAKYKNSTETPIYSKRTHPLRPQLGQAGHHQVRARSWCARGTPT